FHRARYSQAEAGPGPRQEASRQAPDRSQAGLGVPEGAAAAGEGLRGHFRIGQDNRCPDREIRFVQVQNFACLSSLQYDEFPRSRRQGAITWMLLPTFA